MSETTASPGLFDCALRRITTVWRDMADRVSSDEDQGIASQMRACLDARGGEVSACNRAAKLAQTYRGPGRCRRALDPVAHFHLSNGAAVERIVMGADTAGKAVRVSATLMVNCLCDPAKIEDYYEDYAGEGKRNASTAVRRLARGWS